MPEKYGELELYFGLCRSDGFSEGRFDVEAIDDGARLAVARARGIIEKYLSPERKWGLTIGWSDGVARSEEEALGLIEYASRQFEVSHGLIVPKDCMHGDLCFSRKLIIMGISSEDMEETIRKFIQSGHLPCTREQFLYDNFGWDRNRYFEANRKKWQKALKFH